MADKGAFPQLVVTACVLALLYGCVQAVTKDERACETWADSLSSAVNTAIDDAPAGQSSHDGFAARNRVLKSQPNDCSSWRVESTATRVCEAWHEDVYEAAINWPLTVPARKLKSTSATVKEELNAALALKPFEDCASDWKVAWARDRAHVRVEIPVTKVPNESTPKTDDEDSSDGSGMLDHSYSGCRAYVDGGNWVDEQGRRYHKIDCTTKAVIG
jgi:hypothetical protein